ncbi:MAG: lysophospholipase [Bacteroidales bacterium]|jgi:alpha-beta hydrolase superfamily lysophospholipase
MIYKEYNWKSSDNLNLFARSWKPDVTPKFVICFVHGLGEHSGRYNEWAEKFANKNYAFFAVDLSGHGKSEGKRGHAKDYNLLLDDVETLMKNSELIFPGIPKILYGHSMGGNITLKYFYERKPDLRAMIISAPWLELVLKVPKPLLFAAKTISKIFPQLLMSNRLKASDLSHDEAITENRREDVCVHNKISVKLFCLIEEAAKQILLEKNKVNIPLLIIHGTNDKIISFDAAKSYSQTTGNTTTFKAWENFYHELHNDVGREKVFEYIAGWLERI